MFFVRNKKYINPKNNYETMMNTILIIVEQRVDMDHWAIKV